MAQKERENFYRNATVIVDHGKESLSAVLENDLANTKLTFEDFINKHQHAIYHLCYNKSRCCQCPTGRFVPANNNRILHQRQLDKLLDTNGSTLNGHNPNTPSTFQHCCRPAKKSLSTSNIDITLLRCLLMNFAQNCRTNYILRQDIEDLVECRNTLYGHAQEARLNDSDYAKHKTNEEGIILRIAQFCNIENEMRQKLIDVSQRSLDDTILKQFHISLLQQIGFEKNIEEKIDELQQQLTLQDKRLHCRMDTMDGKVSEVGQRKRNIIAHTEACLLEHSKDDTYVVPENIKILCDILEKYKTLIIIAKAGGGKSKTCLQIATMYQYQSHTSMVFVNDEILRNRDLINFDDQNIVIIEDFFGRSNIEFNEDLHKGLFDVLDSCIKNKSCRSKLIITIRSNADNNRKFIEKHSFFKEELFFNLDKNSSLHDNELILTKHMNKHGVSLCNCIQMLRINAPFISPIAHHQCESEVTETNDGSLQICVELFKEICCEQNEMHIGFPQACHLFCSNNNFTKQGMAYFTHASQSLVDEIMNLKKQGFNNNKLQQYQYCALVYTAIKRSLDMNNIDKKCFQDILSYFESKTMIMLLLKEAVLKLEGTYITKSSSESAFDFIKRQQVSDIYVLQHDTIREAILLSYGDDVDVLSFCDIYFVCEYIRPKEYKQSVDDKIVFLFCDYKSIVQKLISMLSIDDATSILVGSYLEVVALSKRLDNMIMFFFQNLKDVKPKDYKSLLNGLTCFGKNPDVVRFHPNLCKTIMMQSGLRVFCAFCRPKGWTEKDAYFVEIETDVLIEKLYSFVDSNKLKENYLESEDYYWNLFDTRGGRHNTGNYVFEYLIEQGFCDIVESFFEQLKQNLQNISPIHVKELLDGLLDGEKRSTIVSQFKDFFEAVLFKYGSISKILQLCIPSTSTINNPNLIKVDDRLLTGKLSAHLESSCAMECGLETRLTIVSKEDGTHFIYYNDFFDNIPYSLIAEYILEHGFKSNNHEFVRTMYEQFASDKIEKGEDDESVNEDSKICLDNGQNEDETEIDLADKCTKVVFDDYPGDEIWENDDGVIVYIRVRQEFVKKKYREENTLSYLGRTNFHLSLVLRGLKPHLEICKKSESKRMALLKTKFKSLLNHISYDVRVNTACMSNV
ncbi:uncharacterized protein [Mytilus edulis]|uniref:uncharacterized protein n=1 Tax=Mytilus edulis TaxID=6550 RepID=UPI0039F01686